MPQLDLIVYYPQFLWFSIGFSLFYLIIVYKIIPIIAFSLKFRKKKISYINNFINNKKSYSFKDFFSYFMVINKILQISRLYLSKVNSNIVMFLSSNYTSMNILFFKINNKNLLMKLIFIYLSFIKIKTLLN